MRCATRCRGPKVLVIGYPSNPTAYVADLPFYERLVAFAREHGLIVISDLAYSEIYFGDTPTPSILQVEGAKEVAVEFTSMSKTYSMAGWRIGFAVGNPRLIAALARVKSYLDYGAFTPIQAAAGGAQRPAGHRRVQPQALQEAPRRAGRMLRPRRLAIPVPQASMFAWAPIPERFHKLGAMEFSKRLLTEAHVAVAPGVGFGEEGEGYVRIALVENEQRLRQAARGVKKMLAKWEVSAGARWKPSPRPTGSAHPCSASRPCDFGPSRRTQRRSGCDRPRRATRSGDSPRCETPAAICEWLTPGLRAMSIALPCICQLLRTPPTRRLCCGLR